jgi:hypothetical protein
MTKRTNYQQKWDTLLRAARAVVIEIDKCRGLKIDSNGILDRLHPIAIFGEHLSDAIKAVDNHAPRTTNGAMIAWFPTLDDAREYVEAKKIPYSDPLVSEISNPWQRFP